MLLREAIGTPPNTETGGIYKITTGKRSDSIYQSLSPEIVKNLKIPRPFARLAPLGD
jgi:hypothetical protein